MQANVLITGGAGFIGSALSARLAELGHRVVAMDVLHPQVHGGRTPILHPEVQLLLGDVTHSPNWEAVLGLTKPDVVVHLAAETGTGQSLSEASRHGLVNVVGTTRLLDALYRSEHRPAHLVLASSRAVYGEGRWISADGTAFYPGFRPADQLEAGRWDCVGESGEPAKPLPSRAVITEPRPSNVYAATKLAQEHLLLSWGAALGVAVSILRLQNVYGPGQSLTNSYTGVLALFAQLAEARQPIEVYEDGAIWRDFVFVEDVVTAITQCIEQPPKGGRLLDVGSGQATTILEIAQGLAALTGAPDPMVCGRYRQGDVRAAVCDLRDTEAQLGYRPAWPATRGLPALLAWVTSQHDVGLGP